MKVLVTGGAGFISSHIVDALILKGYDVCIIDDMTNGKESNINPKALLYKIDIRDESVIKIFQKERPDILIHNAAQISVPNSVTDPINDASINIMGSLNILEAARKTGVKKIIYPASAAIFGEPEYLPIDEEHPLGMLCGYGVTKHTVEHYLKIYKNLYGIDYMVLRYSNVYGPRQDSSGEGGVVAIFCEKMLNDEKPYIFGDGEQIRDFVYVKDVAKANIMAIESNLNGIYNICTNQKMTVNKLFNLINEITDKNLTPIYTSEREGDIKNSYMSYDKAKNDLGWIPEYTIVDGLKEVIDYYNQNM